MILICMVIKINYDFFFDKNDRMQILKKIYSAE